MRIPAATLRRFIADIFEAAGTSPAEAGRIGRYLVAANLTGHDSHGAVRVPRYVQNLKNGEVLADRTISIERETPVSAVIDGNDGFGQTVTPQAVQVGIDKAKASGLSAIAFRNTGHLGRAGDWAEMAAEQGLVSIHFVNVRGSLLVAPFGGVDRMLSTAPFCMAVPIPGRPLLLLDFATSLVAEGKVLVASRGGKKVPDDALVRPDGQTSGDPATLYGDLSGAERNPENGGGAIRTFGLHKGSGLAFMCEILGGALTGNGTCGPRAARRGAIRNGMMSFYLCPDLIGDPAEIAARAERYIAFFKSSRPAVAGGEVLVPGEPEARTRAEREANGVPLPPESWASIVAAAQSVGLGEASIPAAA
ncbi:MAG: malate/lactate/ureidoglycolate dehydrogenase [Acetobacteraceae bacterium]|nr:malate/lactate/ureidoglycolate dehydrogenase [Acetobacteraceae bacterium]